MLSQKTWKTYYREDFLNILNGTCLFFSLKNNFEKKIFSELPIYLISGKLNMFILVPSDAEFKKLLELPEF